ncbi:MAG: DNA translocase FtsK [Thermanaerothrix sp.]|uniref:DNA translocase FtsK n=1 Tax=Thermanaerothrix sp. TaxID=2972675 RepID=UPI003C7CBC90
MRVSPRLGSNRHSEAPPSRVAGSEPSSSWLGNVVKAWILVERFGRDAAGLSLLILAVLSLLGMTSLSQGSLISPWGLLLKRGFGLGGYGLILLLAYLGAQILWGHAGSPPIHFLKRFLSLEGALFAWMAWLSMMEGLDLERAESGLDGGIIGWALGTLSARILLPPLNILLWFTLWVGLTLIGLGLWERALAAVKRWVEQERQRLVTSSPTEAVTQAPSPSAPPSPSPHPAPGAVPVTIVNPGRDPRLPPLNLLIQEETNGVDEERILVVARKIEQTLAEFGLPAQVVGYRRGPTVTQFAVEPGFIERLGPDGQPTRQKVRVSQISSLSRDLALALAAERLRIEAPVPGHSYVGIEVPNSTTTPVRLRPILESETFQRLRSPLALALGRDVSGQPVVVDLERMPHLLIAGTTGSGKSVCLASLITCLVMNNTPEQLRLAIMDPKMVELARFDGLPHLLGRVETEIERMLAVLRWALTEMDQRYRLFEAARARDLNAYNAKQVRKDQPGLPRIVIIIDELADLMMSAPDQTEHSLVRLAQLARATGIHLVIATQRPSTDVLTGLIKANFPARIAFAVASSVDSRVILDTNGAEALLGRGDMLFLNPEVGTPIRAQGVIMKDSEINRVVAYWHQQATEPQEAPWEALLQEDDNETDDLLEQAIALVRRAQRASASLLQRRLRIGYPRAARLLDELEAMGIVGPAQGGGREREVLLPPEEDDQDAYPDEETA